MRNVLNAAIEGLTRPELLEIQLQRILAQVRRCSVEVPFYRDRWRATAAGIRSVEEFRETIPFTTKADFVEGLPERTGRLASGSSVFQHHLTSGTTGLGQEVHPISVADHEALGTGWQYQAHWAGIRRGDVVCFTWPVGLQTGGLSAPVVTQRLGLVGVQLGPYSSEDKVSYMCRFQPHALVASPSYITHLSYLFRRRGQRPGEALPNLKALFIAGESYTASWVEETREAWGCEISEWYGLMQGGMNQAFSCELGVLHAGERGVLHCLDHRILSEVLRPGTDEPVEPGESGEMVLTTLTRDAFPVIRFRSGDKVRLLPEPCPCGRPFLGIEAGTIARYDDMMKIRGQNLWPASVDRVLLADPRVTEYAGEVSLDGTGRENVLLRVELVESSAVAEPDRTLEDLQRRVKSATNVTMRVELAAPGSLPRFEFKARPALSPAAGAGPRTGSAPAHQLDSRARSRVPRTRPGPAHQAGSHVPSRVRTPGRVRARGFGSRAPNTFPRAAGGAREPGTRAGAAGPRSAERGRTTQAAVRRSGTAAHSRLDHSRSTITRRSFVPERTVEHPVYRVKWGTPDVVVYDGMDPVKDFYRSLKQQGVLTDQDELLSVNDWGFSSFLNICIFMPGRQLLDTGTQVDDPDAMYVVKQPTGMYWLYDERARLVGEHVFEIAPPEVIKCAPEDVVTEADIQTLIAPYLPEPATVAATASV